MDIGVCRHGAKESQTYGSLKVADGPADHRGVERLFWKGGEDGGGERMLEFATRVMAGPDLAFCRVDRGLDLELGPDREEEMDLTRAGTPETAESAKNARINWDVG